MPMPLTVLHVKLVHTLIFVVLSACVLYILASGAFNRITVWTWGAVVAIVVEGLVLAASGGKCPLTAMAERLGAVDGSVSIFSCQNGLRTGSSRFAARCT